MTKIKICGLTTVTDALAAAEAGADLIGFNFYKKSPRYLLPEAAQPICDTLRKQWGENCPLLVGLFVNEIVGNISAITNKVGLDCAQLSGDESDDMVKELRGLGFKAIRPLNAAQALDDINYYRPHLPTNEKMPSLLLDANLPGQYGGTGVQVNVELALAVKAEVPRLMLAGGLTPENVAETIAQVQPWGVDVASGVETEPGKKDPAKIKAFIQAVRGS
ncbi:MAG TPA: phosphoribosylanthranilate isomerase [Phototrophicaceae bacterium]|nr:phosphoribosylanthranilate isomerase [Phototrophicaceae bacterium]